MSTLKSDPTSPLTDLYVQRKALLHQISEIELFDEVCQINIHCDQVEAEVKKACGAAIQQFIVIEQDLLAQAKLFRSDCLDRHQPQRQASIKDQLKALGPEIEALVSSEANDADVQKVLVTTGKLRARANELESKLKDGAFASDMMSFEPSSSVFQEKDEWARSFHLSLNFSASRVIQRVPKKPYDFYQPGMRFIFVDDSRLAFCDRDGALGVRDFKSNTELFDLQGHSDFVISLAMLPDGSLASGSEDATIKIWDLSNGEVVSTLTGHSGPINSLKVLPNGRLASYSIDNTIKIWDIASGNLSPLRSMTGHGNKKWAIPFDVLPDGRLVTFTKDKADKQPSVLRVWNPEIGKLVQAVPTGLKQAMTMVVVSNDSVAMGFYDGTIKLVNLKDPTESMLIEKAHRTYLSAFCMLPGGQLVSAGLGEESKATINCWDPASMNLLKTTSTGLKGHIKWMKISPDSLDLITGFNNHKIHLWPISSLDQ